MHDLIFYYKGKNKNDESVYGSVEANSRREAILQIKNNDIVVILSLKSKNKKGLLDDTRLSTKRMFSKVGRRKTKPKKKEVEQQSVALQNILKKIETANNITVSKSVPDKALLDDSKNIFNIFIQADAKTVQEEVMTEQKPKFKEVKPIREIKEKETVYEKSVDWNSIQIEESKKSTIKLKYKVIRVFTKRLAILLSSGVSLTQSLLMLQKTDNKKMKSVCNSLYNDIQEGNTLTYALSKFPRTFNKLYLAMVQIGESSGTLAECLTDITEFMDQGNKITKKIRGAMIYPIIIFVVVLLMMVLGSIFFIPMFSELFVDMAIPLPTITKVVFAVSDHIVLFVGIPAAFFILMHLLMIKIKPLREAYKKITDKINLRLPVIGNFIQTVSMFYFSHTLALMIKNGIRLLDSLSLTQEAITNTVINHELNEVSELIINGSSLSESLAQQAHFEPLVSDIISTGEESGKMHFALKETSKYYEEQVEGKTVMISELVQPISILIVALFIVLPVLLAIFLPLIDVSTGGGAGAM